MNGERPASKQELKDAIANGERVVIEALQFFGSEYSGPLEKMPDGQLAGIVGPDPYIARDWYATIRKHRGKVIVT